MIRNNAFDTETVAGNIVVIGFDDETYLEFPTLDQILTKLTKNPNKTRYFTYNIRFDVDGIFKMLPFENIAELMDEKDTVYGKWKLHYLGANNVVIHDISNGGPAVKIWDLAQFYKYLKLGAAAEKYLPPGQFKQESEVISVFVDSENGQNTVTYYKDHHDEINYYCTNDARITKLLADYFAKKCEAEGYNFNQPYSLGNMAIKWFKPYLVNPDYNRGAIPRIHPIHWRRENPARQWLESIMAQLARGGWNNSFKRGRFENAFDYDIVSAYAAIMRDIPYWDGHWRKIYNEDEIGKAEYGFVTVQMKNLHLPLLPNVYYYFDESFIEGKPIKWVNSSVLHCTVGSEVLETTLTIDQWRYLKDFCEMKSFMGYILEPKHDLFPMRKAIDELTERKFRAKKKDGKDSPEYWIAKTIMNSTSGKFIQKFHSLRTWFYYPHVYSKITWKTKEIMANLITKNNAWDDIISVSTDGAVFTRKLRNIDLSGKLGTFEEDEYKEFVQVGNGIYFGETITGEIKERMRGFRISKKNIHLGEIIKAHPDKRVFEFPTTRPLHLKECYKHNKQLKILDVNRFVKVVRHLNINKEIKQKWFGKFENVKDMLSGRILEGEAWEIRKAQELSKAAALKIEKEKDELM